MAAVFDGRAAFARLRGALVAGADSAGESTAAVAGRAAVVPSPAAAARERFWAAVVGAGLRGRFEAGVAGVDGVAGLAAVARQAFDGADFRPRLGAAGA
jgi:hypothetical protein